MWIDSHAHLDCFIEADELDAVLARAQENGVGEVVAIGGTPLSNERALHAARSHDTVHAVIGYDRDEAEREPSVDLLRTELQDPVAVGVGETGLDYFYSAETAGPQCDLMERMLHVAIEHALPVIVHTRDAEDDTLRLLRAYAGQWGGRAAAPGVIHCYTGGVDFARALMDLGFMISFSGIVTFKKADELREVVKVVPDDLLLIETDAPYLAPVPYRGKRNEPAFVPHVGEVVATVRGQPLEDIARITADNARRLFVRREGPGA